MENPLLDDVFVPQLSHDDSIPRLFKLFLNIKLTTMQTVGCNSMMLRSKLQLEL